MTNALAQQQAAALRAIARMIEENPHLARWLNYSFGDAGISVHLDSTDKAAQQAEFARAARRHGATTTKDVGDTFHNLEADFGAVKLVAVAYREEVCERVVTGVETITETVPDPAVLATVPTVEITREVETVEWVCKPLLAPATTSVKRD